MSYFAAGASVSNAKYTFCLPECRIVAKGWLYPLWSTFTARSNVGMVVPLVVSYPKRLPAALGTVQQDGSVSLHGQGILSKVLASLSSVGAKFH
jgi:hypothetical protein